MDNDCAIANWESAEMSHPTSIFLTAIITLPWEKLITAISQLNYSAISLTKCKYLYVKVHNGTLPSSKNHPIFREK